MEIGCAVVIDYLRKSALLNRHTAEKYEAMGQIFDSLKHRGAEEALDTAALFFESIEHVKNSVSSEAS